ncbi:hypothetical protein O3M35_006769 [Rhynocoris fuscipes]|uniref:Uncharacterized protein n=1 Tax=Rhynocoris fuscipes TaxID=488301 RepID=A0AAW1DID6_9HEMI
MAGDDSHMVRAMLSNRTVRFSVIAPDDPGHPQSLRIILPIIKLAIRNISDERTGILPGWKINVTKFDSFCSSTYGPLAAFEVKDRTGKSIFDYFISFFILSLT